MPSNVKPLHQTEHKVNFCLADTETDKFETSGTINGHNVSTIIRDTGCSCIIISDKILPDVDISNCKTTRISDYLGRESEFPLVRCYIRCKFFEGWAEVARAPIKFCSVLIGNVPGVKDVDIKPTDESASVKRKYVSESSKIGNYANSEQCKVVRTRGNFRAEMHPLVLPSLEPLNVTPEEFSLLQQTCESLQSVRNKVASGEIITHKDGSSYKYIKENDLIYRLCVDNKSAYNRNTRSLVVPSKWRKTGLLFTHESPLAGHFSYRKTKKKISAYLFWPGMTTDVTNYVQSCDKCQRMCAKGRTKPAPFVKMSIFSEPFLRVSMDLVGPIIPSSSEGHKYILTLIDWATGFPEAIPLRSTTTIAVAEALIEIFSRVGIPREIQSDNGPQFVSQLMGEIHRLLGVKPIFSTVYRPQTSGRVERFHSTLKSCLRKLCEDKPREWHRYLAPTLFAVREMPSDRSGFSAFELLYGRPVRGPLQVLKDLWENRQTNTDERETLRYVLELQKKLEDCSRIAAENSSVSATKYKEYFDVKSQSRTFAAGDEILLLLPEGKSKLLIAWKGPFKVLEKKVK